MSCPHCRNSDGWEELLGDIAGAALLFGFCYVGTALLFLWEG